MPFRFDKLTQKAQEAVQQAQEIAGQNGHQAVHPLHLLIALANESEGIVHPVLEKCGVNAGALVNEAQRLLSSLPKVSGQQTGMYISPALNLVF
jgi:ATP-dependent Clp protease ATP-binding subunit ClpB